MSYHGVLIPSQIAAMNVDSYNRSVVDAADIDNGWVFTMGAKSTTSGESEVWEISQNTSASPTGLWMAYSGDEIVVTDLRYKGIDPNPRNFYNIATKTFSAFKPQVGDIITVTAEALTGSYVAASTVFVNAVASSWKLEWATAQSASGLSYALTKVTYISIATGGIDSQRVTAYELECVAN